jgi:hypothetical protein
VERDGAVALSVWFGLGRGWRRLGLVKGPMTQWYYSILSLPISCIPVKAFSFHTVSSESIPAPSK